MKNFFISENKLINTTENNKKLYWNTVSSNKNENIITYLEKDRSLIRQKYLEFIFNLNNNLQNDRKFKKLFTYNKNYNLWDMSLINEKCPIKSKCISDCLKLIVLENLITRYKPKKITLDFDRKDIIDSIKYLCANRIEVIIVRKYFHYNFLNINKYYIFFKTLYFILNFLYLTVRTRKKRPRHSPDVTDQVSIFSYLINFNIDEDKKEFHSSYWGDLPSLLEKKFRKINWHHYPTNNLFDNNISKTLDNLSSENNSHCIIFNKLNYKIFFLSVVKYFHIYFNSFFIDKVKNKFLLKNSKINLWFLLEDNWIKSIQGSSLFYSIIVVNIFDAYFKDLPHQKLGFYLYENQSWEKAMITAWKNYRHGKIIGVAHSSIRFWDLRYFNYYSINVCDDDFYLPTYVSVNGELSKNTLINNNFPAERILETESLRYNYLLNIKKVNAASSNNVLLLGDIDKEATLSMIYKFRNVISTLPESYRYEFRSHPGSEISLRTIPEVGILDCTSDFKTAIDQNSIIVITGSSTSAIEALFYEKNVIIYTDYRDVNLSPLSEVQGIRFATSASELTDLIKNNHFSKTIDKEKIFWLNKDLPRWKKVISIVDDNENV